jgi:hypothetical protein
MKKLKSSTLLGVAPIKKAYKSGKGKLIDKLLMT